MQKSQRIFEKDSLHIYIVKVTTITNVTHNTVIPLVA